MVEAEGRAADLERSIQRLELVRDTAVSNNQEGTEPHRLHDPEANKKRTDPFEFGHRYLQAEDDVFEFNAWDHVAPDDVYKEYAESQIAKQREAPVSDFDKGRSTNVFRNALSCIMMRYINYDLTVYGSVNDTNLAHVFRSYLIRFLFFCTVMFSSKAKVADPMSDRFNSDPAKWWNQFYKNNTSNFFKDRKWLRQEFPILSDVTQADAGPVTLLEVGAGAGNTAFPILANNHNQALKIHACDFSKKAVEVMRENAACNGTHMQADVWDVAGEELPPDLEESSVDIVLMIFIFSALSPKQWEAAVQNIYRVLKPGGQVLFRDYGRGDLAQLRFKKGRYMEENFYVRGDGTRVYFFEEDELSKIWIGHAANGPDGVAPQSRSDGSSPQFQIQDLGFDRRLLVNRGLQKKMYRCWIQARFKKI